MVSEGGRATNRTTPDLILTAHFSLYTPAVNNTERLNTSTVHMTYNMIVCVNG